MFEKTKSGLLGLIKTITQEVWEQLQTSAVESTPAPPEESGGEPPSLLTDEQRAFMLRFYFYARRAAVRVAGRLGVDAQVVDDLLETAAVDALVAVAKRSTDPDYIPGKDRCILMTAIYRQVRNALAKFYGWHSEKPTGVTLRGLVEFVGGSRFPNPVDEAIRREEEERRSPAVRKAKTLMGEFVDHRLANGTVSEFEALKSKLQQFGLSCRGRVEALRERLAAHMRQQLGMPSDESSRPSVPKAVARRLSSPVTDGEDVNVLFVRAWETSSCVKEVADTLGLSYDAVRSRASYMRRNGVQLKLMPRGRRMMIRTVSRRVLAMSPCLN